MLLPSKLIHELKRDHLSLRKHLPILKNEEEEELKLKETFASLASELISHSKREEQVVHKFMLNNADLRHMAFEGREEHRLLEILIAELEFQSFGEKWFAKAKVFAELLEHYLTEEEAHVLPELKKYLDSELDELLLSKFRYPDPSSGFLRGESFPAFATQSSSLPLFMQFK